MFAGCAVFESREVVVTTIVTQPSEGTVKETATDFGLIGRVLVKADKHGFSGGVHWQHTDISDELLLFSPLGQTVAQIDRGPEGVYLITSEQKTYYASSVEDLTEDVLGWRLPLSGLQFWVLGTHFPFTMSEKDLDSNGRTVAIRQDGWKITYLDYFSQPVPAYNILPRVLELSRVDLKLRLVIDNWKIKD
jgi:outer membrane lipoprotein LolB